MATFLQVDPQSFVDVEAGQPEHGRGSWTRTGISFDYRYALSENPAARIGTLAQESTGHWAVAAGCYAIQRRLQAFGHLGVLAESERGIFGPRTQAAVKAFQAAAVDPESSAPLVVDGIVGTSDARALFTPVIDAAERKHGIPAHYLRGECNHESRLDPGAVGYFVFYPEFRGVDRGAFQVNSKAHAEVTWAQAFDFLFMADWSAARMRGYFDKFKAAYPKLSDDTCWRAAILAHNNPAAATTYARTGSLSSTSGAAYVNAVLTAIY